jgi:hypothetical protein
MFGLPVFESGQDLIFVFRSYQKTIAAGARAHQQA